MFDAGFDQPPGHVLSDLHSFCDCSALRDKTGKISAGDEKPALVQGLNLYV